MLNCKLLAVCLADDASNMSNYVRSSSPEYDEVVSMYNSDESHEEEEFSEQIPIPAEQRKIPDQDKDEDAVVFDDSESGEFSLPHVDWSSITSLLPSENTSEALVPVCDKANADLAAPCLSAESESTNPQCEVSNSVVMLNAADTDYRVEVSEAEVSISEGLVFDISSVGDMEQETTLKFAESPVPSTSRLSRKRSRVSRDDQQQCKRLHHNVDVPTESEHIILPRPLQDSAGSDGANLLPSYNNVQYSNDESELPSYTIETTVVSSGCDTPNVFSQDCDASFSQGI